MSIYTKTGDGGYTSLRGGGRIEKESNLIELLGGLDELNSALGRCRVKSTNLRLRRIQQTLMKLSAEKADPNFVWNKETTVFWEELTNELETWIDEEDDALPPLRNFLIPGGTRTATEIMWTRAVARRVERQYLKVSRPDSRSQYLNRLSDYLFVASRTANHKAEIEDDLWINEGR